MKKNKISFDLRGGQVSQKQVEAIASAFSDVSKTKSAKHFSLALVSGPEIRKWNLIYRGKDKVTDVLSFAESDAMDFPEPGSLDGRKQCPDDLGEILICWPQLRRQAKEYGWSNEIEFARLLVHGLAHLSGYDHENVSKLEAKKMTDFEQSVLNKLRIKFDV